MLQIPLLLTHTNTKHTLSWTNMSFPAPIMQHILAEQQEQMLNDMLPVWQQQHQQKVGSVLHLLGLATKKLQQSLNNATQDTWPNQKVCRCDAGFPGEPIWQLKTPTSCSLQHRYFYRVKRAWAACALQENPQQKLPHDLSCPCKLR